MMRTPPANTTPVKDPKWTGDDAEMAVIVGRGEPARTDVQMQQAVHGQISRYLPGYTDLKLLDLHLTLTAQLIAQDHIKPGVRVVSISRTHLLAYVRMAQEKIRLLGGGE